MKLERNELNMVGPMHQGGSKCVHFAEVKLLGKIHFLSFLGAWKGKKYLVINSDGSLRQFFLYMYPKGKIGPPREIPTIH